MTVRELGRARAQHARKFVADKAEAAVDHRRGLVRLANSLPPSIRINGFGMALAHAMASHGGSRAKAKGKPVNEGAWAMLDRLAHWLLAEADAHGVAFARDNAKGDGVEALLASVVDGQQDDYRAAMAEALEYLQWLKILAASIDPGEEDEPASEGGNV